MKRLTLINSCAAAILTVGLTCAAQASHHAGGMSGIASVYSGGRTANGEHASAGGLTAAHRSLPFGTLVKVTNRHSQRSVVVRINDRGPFVGGRVIDLTPAAARAIGFSGLAPVSLSVVGHGGSHHI
jgi:peptidoglycan lytic transglycosylase